MGYLVGKDLDDAADPSRQVVEIAAASCDNFINHILPAAERLCIHSLVEEQAIRTPDAVALEYAGLHFTYRALDRRSNQVAHHLQRLGVGPECLVGLYTDRSPEMIVGLLGILKAGGAYLPLDPVYAGERLAFMLADAGVEIVLTTEKLARTLPERVTKAVCLDAQWPEIGAESTHSPASGVTARNIAYVIYTSGSTGQPKGVLIEHSALVNYITAAGEQFAIGPGDRMLQFASIGFDAAVEEIFCALTRGATLVLRTEGMLGSPARFLQVCHELRLTVLDLPTAYWHTWMLSLAGGDVALPPSLRLVIIGGESALLEPVQAWRRLAPSVRLVNTYGPTEATIVATLCDLAGPLEPQEPATVAPIGRPVANVYVHLLDEEMQPVAAGMPGEMYIGGAGLARGYLNRPELTAQKFVADPYGEGDAARLYKTGDLGRLLPDGSIQFLGRRDNQVKVRGFRIELGEVEAALNEHPAVGQAVVTAPDDDAGSKQLVAYFVATPGHELDIADLRAHLSARLPSYMAPAAYVQLAGLPLNANGKVDRKHLPPPSQAAMRATAYAPPRTALELQLADIWETVLGRSPIGIQDNFFEIGGHSLTAARLFVQIEGRLGRSLPLTTLLQAPTIAELALVMQDGHWTPPWASLAPIQPLGDRPPFFCVHGFGGDVVGYRDLAHLLGMDQPFYGFQARGLNDLDEPHSDIGEMASEYIRFMRQLQPHGPYYLGGYCYGGVVAFEMARQLVEAGERVDLVAVIEGYAVARRAALRQHWRPQVLARFARNLPYWLHDNLRPEGPYACLLPWQQLRRSSWLRPDRQGQRCPLPLAEAGNQFAARRQRLEAAHDRAMERYQPGSYRGRITLLRVRAMSLFRAHDPTMGWADWAEGGVDVRMIEGTHYNLLEQPHVASVAAQLRQCLDAAQGRAAHGEDGRSGGTALS